MNTFKIHPSHSRKELFDIISIFSLPIKNKNDFNKSQLQMRIVECLKKIENILPECEYFFVEDKNQLRDYLIAPNPAKNLSVKEKDSVMFKCKKLINYARNNYYLMPSSYMSFEDVYMDAVHISKHAEIPSVRRAIDLLNKDPKLAYPIDLEIPKRIKNQLEKKKKIKSSVSIPLYIKRGRIEVRFD
jgi:uncharacterized protein YbaR (Trm112 family)